MEKDNDVSFGLRWKKSIRCLGIYIGHDEDYNYTNNWSKKIEHINDCLKRWSQRDLTLFGKVHVIKTFALPQVILSATLLPVPPSIIAELNTIFYRFLWGKVDRLKRIKMIRSKSDGGLDMIDVKSMFDSLKAAWIPRIMKGNPITDSWIQIPHYHLSKLGGLEVVKYFSCKHCCELPMMNQIPLFYREVISCYSKSFRIDKDTFDKTILNQPLWGNDYITVRRKGKKNVLLLRNWIRSGVRFVKDLMFVNGILDRQICNRIDKKHNIYVEYLCIRQALYPYTEAIISALTHDVQCNSEPKFLREKSKYFYTDFKQEKVSDIAVISTYLNQYCIGQEIQEKTVFIRRVCLEREKKLKEFNFKLLHGILPCGINLKRWKIRNSSICDVCDQEQSIMHLLFECRYVHKLWEIVNRALGWNVAQYNIVCGSTSSCFKIDNIIITVICFLIYKEWLVLSLEDKGRSQTLNLNLIKNELGTRKSIYEKCKLLLNANQIENLLSYM